MNFLNFNEVIFQSNDFHLKNSCNSAIHILVLKIAWNVAVLDPYKM